MGNFKAVNKDDLALVFNEVNEIFDGTFKDENGEEITTESTKKDIYKAIESCLEDLEQGEVTEEAKEIIKKGFNIENLIIFNSDPIEPEVVEENELETIGEKPMDTQEISRFEALEKEIESNIHGFYNVGMALAEIRDKRLYRKEFTDFDEYCQVKWGFVRRYADMQIAGASNYRLLEMEQKFEYLPKNEGQARPLSRLESDDLKKEAWEKVLEIREENHGVVTGKDVEKVVKEMLGTKLKDEPDNPKLTVKFQKAFTVMYDEIEKDTAEGLWKKMDKEEVQKYIQVLVEFVENNGEVK